jgi:hypothetical protein
VPAVEARGPWRRVGDDEKRADRIARVCSAAFRCRFVPLLGPPRADGVLAEVSVSDSLKAIS